MRNKTCIPIAVIAFGLFGVPLSSMASISSRTLSTASVNPIVANVGQLALEQSKTPLLLAKLENATLEAKIKKVQSSESAKPAAPVSPYANMGMPQPMSIQQPTRQNRRHSTNAVQAPRVLSLMGAGARYTATLALPDGTIMSARPGMALGGGWKVTQVNSDGVLATHNGKVEPLAFSAQSGPSQGASQSMGNGGQTASSFTPPNMGGAPSMGAPGMGAPMLPNGAPMQITPPTGLPPAGLPGQGG